MFFFPGKSLSQLVSSVLIFIGWFVKNSHSEKQSQSLLQHIFKHTAEIVHGYKERTITIIDKDHSSKEGRLSHACRVACLGKLVSEAPQCVPYLSV